MQNQTPANPDKSAYRWGFTILSAVFAGSACWSLAGNSHRSISLILLAAFSAALSQTTTGIINRKSAYRGAALISFAIGAVCWAASGEGYSISSLIFLLTASLVGSMAASWLKQGFTDETFIPSAEITAEIQTMYKQARSKPPRPPLIKRAFDILLSLAGILLTAPVWLMISIMIWLQDPGPILFIKHCTGLRGKPFRLYKFRTMKINAEMATGPVSAAERDQRILRGCRLLRETALDELPQLVNILLGEMSFVGPRPLRSVVEIENLHQIPGYAKRYDTRPGLAGLAQVCGSSQTPSRDKLRYEIMYANHANLLFDIKLIVIACLIVFYLRWKKDWDGRIPRAWLRTGKSSIKKSI
jgi:lipopolysaccharide/colanic/teichoic acid biosynthesis glycosyltransferase